MAFATKMTVPGVRARKGGKALTCVTAYDAPTAALLDEAGVDLVLVGDSVGNVVLGYESTIPVTMDEMVHHVRAVRRGMSRALLIADMPFLSYQPGTEEAIRNAGRFLKEGAEAVKLEGGPEVAGTVAALVAAGIPVMGHVGLMPQRLRLLGGPRSQGRDAASAAGIWRGARALERAGVFAIVLESVPSELARRVTRDCAVPTVGIGAGPFCDGQVLVFHDLVGLTASPPPFAKAWGRGRLEFRRALAGYRRDVESGRWPSARGGADLPVAELAELDAMIRDLGDKA
ncbi:MAG: 3-methyl-2-oxobutanoate hydroxymethyltransferase [Candidatus Coatesbacteria bacterium]